jgi:hypothetical protein
LFFLVRWTSFFSGKPTKMSDATDSLFRRQVIRLVAKPKGPPVLSLAESKGFVEKFRPEVFSSPKVRIIPGEDQVFVVINDKDENLGEYLKPHSKLNIGMSLYLFIIDVVFQRMTLRNTTLIVKQCCISQSHSAKCDLVCASTLHFAE